MKTGTRVKIIDSHPSARSFIGKEGVVCGLKIDNEYGIDQVIVRLNDGRAWPFWKDELEESPQVMGK